MTKTGERLKGFGIGLSMAGIAVLSSGAAQAAQGLCPGMCPGCYACGLTAMPLLLWIAAKGSRRHAKSGIRTQSGPRFDSAHDNAGVGVEEGTPMEHHTVISG